MKTAPLRRVSSLRSETLPEGTDLRSTFHYIDISAVNGDGVIEIPDAAIEFESAPSRARKLAEAGDTVLSTVRTYLRAIAQVPDVEDRLVFSTGFAVLRSQHGHGRFLTYCCRSIPVVEAIVSRSAGVSYPAITPNELMGIEVPNPAFDEQRRIADFLDDRVSRIDRIIAARREQVNLSQDLPWLEFRYELGGTAVRPIRRAIAALSDGPFGSAFSSADYVDSGPAVIRLGNIGFGEFRDREIARVPESIYRKFPATHVSAGDLLIASLGDARNHAGRACVAPEGLGRAMVKGKCYCAKANRSIASEQFLAILLSSSLGAESLVQQGTGATRSMLNFERLLSCLLPIPERSKQDSLVNAFNEARSQMFGAVGALQRSIDLLTEYKSSLITAAVTGELDVTTASTSIPQR